MKKSVLLITLIGVTIFFSCKKQDSSTPSNSSTSFDYKNLTANPDTIHPGDTTSIVANASGSNLQYQWTTSHGDLFGSGQRVVFGAAPCCVGIISVTCIVSDGSHSVSKQINLLVQL